MSLGRDSAKEPFSRADYQVPSSLGFCLQTAKKPRWEKLPAQAPEALTPSCYCKTPKNGTFAE